MSRILAVIVVVLLTGCGSSRAPEPVGIGTDRDELKRSPCGCTEIHSRAVIDA